jgi:hypothetical protein
VDDDVRAQRERALEERGAERVVDHAEGGLRADALTDGEIRVGDQIRAH